MSDSANLSSLEALRQFTAAVVEFQAEAQMCLTAFDAQLRQVQSWLDHDRPAFWKREMETAVRAVEDARVRLHQCRMRRVGDFRPTCFEEQKGLEQAKRWLDFSQSQLPRVRRWSIAAQQESNEFRGRAGGTMQMLQRELPRLLALLRNAAEHIDAYAAIAPPQPAAANASLTRPGQMLPPRNPQASLSESARSEASESRNSGTEERDAAPETRPASEAPTASSAISPKDLDTEPSVTATEPGEAAR